MEPIPAAKRYCQENSKKIKNNELQQEQTINKKHSIQLKRNTKCSFNTNNSHYLSLRNIIKPIALRPSEYETYLLRNFLNMTIKSSNQTTEIIKNPLECSTSNDDFFKSSTISLPLIDNKFITDSNKNDISRFKRLSISNSTEATTVDLDAKKNRLNSPSLLISSQNFIKKKRRLDLDYDTRPHINLQKMKSKLIEEQNHESSQDYSEDFSDDLIDEGIESENQSAYSSSSSFYSNSSYNTEFESISNEKQDAIKLLINEENNNSNKSFSSHNYSNIKFIDIDLNQIEND